MTLAEWMIFAARALGAHINGIEAFPFFAAAVLLAEFRQLPQHWIDELAIAFVVVRLFFVIAYVGNRSTIRTLLWNPGYGAERRNLFHAMVGPRVILRSAQTEGT